jgi:hypothetical protein
MPEYDQVREIDEQRRGRIAPGNPNAAAQALLVIVDAEKPPLRVLFGAGASDRVTAAYEQRLNLWRKWEHVTKRSSD